MTTIKRYRKSIRRRMARRIFLEQFEPRVMMAGDLLQLTLAEKMEARSFGMPWIQAEGAGPVFSNPPIGTTYAKPNVRENVDNVLTLNDFGFSDPLDVPPNNFTSVIIESLPTWGGSIMLDDIAVVVGQEISVGSINAQRLRYVPSPVTPNPARPHQNYLNRFDVNHDGIVDNTDSTAVEARLSAQLGLPGMPPPALPSAAASNAMYFDVSGDNILAPNDLLDVVNHLYFQGAGFGKSKFMFRVKDSGMELSNVSTASYALSFQLVDFTNHAPVGMNTTITALEDSPSVWQFFYSSSASGIDGLFTDPLDNPANGMTGIIVDALPPSTQGRYLTGIANPVLANSFLPNTYSTSDQYNLRLSYFVPAPNVFGNNLGHIKYRFMDNGGTAHGGQNTDLTQRTIAFNITPVNDAPIATPPAFAITEDTLSPVFTAARFGFSDPSDAPAPNLLTTVRILSLPSAADGTLRYNSTPISAASLPLDIDVANLGLLRFMPAANRSGTGLGQFRYRVRDNGGTLNGGVEWSQSDSTMSFNISAVNDPPTAVVDSAIATEAGGVANATPGVNPTGNVLTNDTDPDVGDSKTVIGVAAGIPASATGSVGVSVAGSFGSILISSSGAYTYTVNNSLSAVEALRTSANTLLDTFTYTMRDTAGLTRSARVSITIRGANDSPVVVFDTATAIEAGGYANATIGTNATGNVTTNDTDVDASDTRTVIGVAVGNQPSAAGSVGIAVAGAFGSIVMGSDGAYTYTVNNNHPSVQALRLSTNFIQDVFTYTLRDAAGLSRSTQLSVTITGQNDAPIAVANSTSIVAGQSQWFTVMGNDTDVDAGDTKTVVGAAAGVVPNPLGNVGVTINGTYGSFTLPANDVVYYVPNVNNPTVRALRTLSDTVTDTFTYTMSDAAGLTSSAQISITVQGANDAPIAAIDYVTAREAGGVLNGTPGINPSGNILANDTDYDTGDTKTIVGFAPGVLVNPANWVGIPLVGSYGTILVTTNGDFTYTVDNNNPIVQSMSSGSIFDVFTYKIQDLAGATSTTQVTITIQGASDAPVANNDLAIADEAGGGVSGTNPTGNVLSNDTDVDSGDTKNVDGVRTGGPGTIPTGSVGIDVVGAYGKVNISANGSFVYTLDNNNPSVQALVSPQTLSEVFTYSVRDSAGLKSAAQLSVTIRGVNDAPTITAPTNQTINEDSSATVGFTIGDVDTPLSSLTVSASSSNIALINWPELVISGTGAARTLVATPKPNQSGTAVITLSVFDGAITSQVSFVLTVNPVNDAPTIINGAIVLLPNTVPPIASSPTTVASILSSASWADVDVGALSGIAISSRSGAGNWQYSQDGILWFSILGTLTTSNALLLDSTSRVRYLPNPSVPNETPAFQFVAWDRTSGIATTNGTERFGSILPGGGTSAYSIQSATARLSVSAPVNNAPVLDNSGNPTLPTITEDDINNSGVVISGLVGTSITDADPADAKGIAITQAVYGNGRWEYRLVGGSWTNIPSGSVSNTQSLLLREIDSIRFVPNGQQGTTASISYRAWDQTLGSAGGIADTQTNNGGSTAFSTAVEIASITVTSVNDAPVTQNVSRSLSEDTTRSFLFSDFAFTDPLDAPTPNAFSKVVISSLPINGVLRNTVTNTLIAVGNEIDANAVALGQIVYQPNINFFGSDSFRFRVRDNGGTANSGVDLSLEATFSFTVSGVNDPPILTAQSLSIPLGLPYTLKASDFGYSDPDNDPMASVTFVPPLPNVASGTLRLNGVDVGTGVAISRVLIDAGQLIFVPAVGGIRSTTMSYFASDGQANSNTVTSTITQQDPLPDITHDFGVLPTFSVSHNRKMLIDPRVELKALDGTPLIVTVPDSTGYLLPGETLKLKYGTLRALASGALEYEPDADVTTRAIDRLQPLQAIETIDSPTDSGVVRRRSSQYVGLELPLSLKVIKNLNSVVTILGTASADIRVTNDLPVFRGDLSHNGMGQGFLQSTFASPLDFTIPIGREMTFDVNDYFTDPDGDPIQLRTLTKKEGGFTFQINGVFPSVREWEVNGNWTRRFLPNDRLFIADATASNPGVGAYTIVSATLVGNVTRIRVAEAIPSNANTSGNLRYFNAYENLANPTQIVIGSVGGGSSSTNRYLFPKFDGSGRLTLQTDITEFDASNPFNPLVLSTFGGITEYSVFATDGQKDAHSEFASDAEEVRFPIDIKTRLAWGAGAGLRPRTDIRGDMLALGLSSLSLSPDLDPNSNASAQWDITVGDNSRRLANFSPTALGNLSIDPVTGGPIVSHSINLDESSGLAETSFGGLVFDGDSAYANPTITANIKQLAGTAKISKITGTLFWRDHLRDQGNGDDVFEKTSTYTFPVNNPQSEYSLSFRARDIDGGQYVPRYSGVYTWVVKLKLELSDSTQLEYLHRGESAVVVQNTARAETPFDPGSFNYDGFANWNRNAVFGDGWELAGLPSLYNDEHGQGIAADPFSVSNVDYDSDTSRDRWMIAFPGEAPRIFGADFSAEGRAYRPIEIGTDNDNSAEFGQLRFDSNTNQYEYESVDHTIYTFTRFGDYNPEFMFPAAGNYPPLYLLTSIKAAGKAPLQINRSQDWFSPSYGNIQSIVASDGSTTVFNYANDYQLSSLTLPGNRVVEFHYEPGSTEQANLLKAIKHQNPTGTNMVRQFSYSNKRILTDSYRTDVDGAIVQKTTFEYDDTDPDGATNQLTNPNRALKKVTFGQADALQNEVVYLIKPAGFVGYLPNSFTVPANTTLPKPVDRVTEIRLKANDLMKLSEVTNPNPNLNYPGVLLGTDAAHVSIMRYDLLNHVRSQESRFTTSASSTGQLLSQKVFNYDHVGQVSRERLYNTFVDYTQVDSGTATTLPFGGRDTTYVYDYSIIPTYESSTDPTGAGNDDLTPKYDTDDYRGNAIAIVDHSGVARFEYETDDEFDNAVGTLTKSFNVMGFETDYKFDKAGRMTERKRKRSANGTTATEAIETWNYGPGSNDKADTTQLVSMTDPLGLITTYQYDGSRRPFTVTVTDNGGTTGDVELRETTFAYDTFGYVDSVTLQIDGKLISTTDTDFDSLGLILKRQVFDSESAKLSEISNAYYADGNTRLTTRRLAPDPVSPPPDPYLPSESLTEYFYDLVGRVTKVVDGKNAQFPVASNSGTLASIEETTETAYYSDGTIRKTTKPDQNTDQFFADPANFTSWTKISGVAHSNDALYNPANALATTDQVFSQVTDFLGRITQERDLLVSFADGVRRTYAYEDPRVDSPTKVTDKTRLASTAVNTDMTAEYTYDPLARVLVTKQPGQPVRNRTRYDEFSYPKKIEVLSTAGAKFDIKTDVDGNVLSQDETRFTNDRNASAYQASTVTTTNQYDAQGRLRRVSAGGANEKTDFSILEVVGSPNVLSVLSTDRNNITSSVSLDAMGRTVADVNALGGVTITEYDIGGRPVKVTLPDNGSGARTTVTNYDQLDRARRSTQVVLRPDGNVTANVVSQSDYFTTDRTTWDMIVVDPRGYQTKTMLDSVGNTVAVQYPANDSVTNGGDANAAPATLMTMQYAHNAGESTTQVRTYTTAGNPSAASPTVDPLAKIRLTENYYSESNRLLQENIVLQDGAPLLPKTVYTYGPHGMLVKTVDSTALTRYTELRYDLEEGTTATGKLTEQRVVEANATDTPLSEAKKFNYDSAGNMTHETTLFVGLANGRYRKFDDFGRIIQEEQLINSANTGGAASERTVTRTWSYPLGNGSTQVVYVDRNGSTTTQTLTPSTNQKVTTITSGASIFRQGSYSKTETLFDDGSLQTINDRLRIQEQEAGPLVERSRSSFTFEYDTLGRSAKTTELTAFEGAGGPASRVTKAWSPTNQPSSMLLEVGITTLNGPPTQPLTAPATWKNIATESYGYDSLGRLVVARQVFNRGEASSWVGQNIGGDKRYSITYDHLGNAVDAQRRTAPTGTTFTDTGHTRKTFFADGRVKEIFHNTTNGTTANIAGFDTTYDTYGRTLVRTNNYYDGTGGAAIFTENATHTYDRQGRLTAVNYSAGRPGNNGYGWDSSGRRTDDARQSGNEARIKEDTTYRYRYDEEGNLAARIKKSDNSTEYYYFDVLNRLTIVEEWSGAATPVKLMAHHYGYDALDRQIGVRHQAFVNGNAQPATFEFRVSVVSDPILVMDATQRISEADFIEPNTGNMLAVDLTGANAGTYWAFGTGNDTVTAWARRNGTTSNIYHTVYDPNGKIVPNNLINPSIIFAPPLVPFTALAELPRVWSGLRLDSQIGFMGESGVWYNPESGDYTSQVSTDDVMNPYRFNGGDPVAAVSTAYSTIAAKRQQANWETYTIWADVGHAGLNAIGVVDPFGVADGINALWYVGEAAVGREGAMLNAGISAAGALLPYAGDVLKVIKGGATAAKACDTVRDLTSAQRLSRGAYHASVGAGVGATIGGGVALATGGDALAGASMGALQGGVGGFARGFMTRALRACFTAGTPLVVDFEGNSRPIEEIQVGDHVLARDEFDANGPLELRQVEELFTRVSPVIEIVVRGKSIGTTVEHPFYVPAKNAFIPAGELQIGDELVGHDGQLLTVEALRSTGDVVTVYNMRVADFHTYFVGGAAWGFDVWVHNAVCSTLKGSRLIANNPQVKQLADVVTDATTQAEATIAKMTHLTAATSSRRMNLYLDVLKAQNNVANKLSTKLIAKFTNKQGVVDWDRLEAMTKGHAIQALVDRALNANTFTRNLIDNGTLLLNKGSRLGIPNSKGNLVRPDYQLDLGNGKWAILDVTTTGQAGKAMDKYAHRNSPFLFEILY